MAESKMSLKLVVDTKANKVLFAEADKLFVDFLFHILALPIGSAVKLLTEKGTIGSLGDLCRGFEALHNDYFQANLKKDFVLEPRTDVDNVPLLPPNHNHLVGRQFYRCGTCFPASYVTDINGRLCPSCHNSMYYAVRYTPSEGSIPIPSSSSGGVGYVKEVIKYMVMDNLEVKPFSAPCIVNNFAVKDAAAVVVKEVQVGLPEGLDILKASFQTQTVLTTVFLGSQKKKL